MASASNPSAEFEAPKVPRIEEWRGGSIPFPSRLDGRRVAGAS